jgi:hypothetical protein
MAAPTAAYFNMVRRYPGLVSYWRLDESSPATTAVDSSAHNEFNGIYQGFAASPHGALIEEYDTQAASQLFTPSSYIFVANAPQLELNVSFSLEAWIATSYNQSAIILGKLSNGIAAPYALGLNNGVLQLSVGNGTTQTTLSGPQVPPGLPSRVSASLFRNTLYVCLNGTVWPVTLSAGTQPIADRAQPVTFGNFAGLMAEVAIYNMALSALQHARNFAVGRQIISDPSHFITVDPPVYV